MGGVEWISVAQNTDSWWALMNMLMNLRVSWLAEVLSASVEGHCFMEVVSYDHVRKFWSRKWK
jgi:hypothetical protein